MKYYSLTILLYIHVYLFGSVYGISIPFCRTYISNHSLRIYPSLLYIYLFPNSTHYVVHIHVILLLMWSYGGGSIPSVIQGAEQWHGDDPRQPVGGSTAGSASTGHLRRSRQVHGKASNSISWNSSVSNIVSPSISKICWRIVASFQTLTFLLIKQLFRALFSSFSKNILHCYIFNSWSSALKSF